MSPVTKKRAFALGLSVAFAGIVIYAIHTFVSRGLPEPDFDPSFAGLSTELKDTEVVPLLSTRIEDGKNLIWCASFLAAWKTLEQDITAGPVYLDGATETCARLNAANDVRDQIPSGSLYVKAGWVKQGVIEEIHDAIRAEFPGRELPTFPGIIENSFLAYAYLEANVRFRIPYFQNRKPLLFTDATGTDTELTSFGIRPEDDYAYLALREQPALLFVERGKNYRVTECAVDLDRTSEPSQIILALVHPEETLSETLASLEERIDAGEGVVYGGGLGPNDSLLVPDMSWCIEHHYAELEGRPFMNPGLEGQIMDVAQQDIVFRLDRSGAELRSESKTYVTPIPTAYIFNRPFLVLMRTRATAEPYFVMWVANAELLRRWEKTGKG